MGVGLVLAVRKVALAWASVTLGHRPWAVCAFLRWVWGQARSAPGSLGAPSPGPRVGGWGCWGSRGPWACCGPRQPAVRCPRQGLCRERSCEVGQRKGPHFTPTLPPCQVPSPPNLSLQWAWGRRWRLPGCPSGARSPLYLLHRFIVPVGPNHRPAHPPGHRLRPRASAPAFPETWAPAECPLQAAPPPGMSAPSHAQLWEAAGAEKLCHSHPGAEGGQLRGQGRGLGSQVTRAQTQRPAG